MASVAEWSLLGLIVFAAAETDFLLLIRILIFSLEHKLKRLVGASFLVVRAIAEGLILGSTASAIVVSLSLLKSNLVGLVLGDLCLLATLELRTVIDIALRFCCWLFLLFVLDLLGDWLINLFFRYFDWDIFIIFNKLLWGCFLDRLMFFFLGLFWLHKGFFNFRNWLFLSFSFFKGILLNLVFPLFR